MADIFLSYARENHEQARMLAELFASFGWSVFWDREILAGTVFDDVIQQELDRTKCVVCLWSVHSVSSQWVRAEAEEGANRNMLVSILVEDVRLPIAFRRIQAARLMNWSGSRDDEQLRDVLKAVRFVVDKPPQEAAAAAATASAAGPTSSAATVRPAAAPAAVSAPAGAAGNRSFPTAIVGAVVGVALLGAGGWYMTRSSGTPAAVAQRVTPQPSTPAPSPPREPSAQPPAGVPAGRNAREQRLLTNAKQFAELVGTGRMEEARNYLVPELKERGGGSDLETWAQNSGDFVAIENVQRAGPPDGPPIVSLVMRHQRRSALITLTMLTNGLIKGIRFVKR